MLLADWRAKVRYAAEAAWTANRPLFVGDVTLHVTHYSERRIADRDNLLKPIQDALQGLAYVNDKQVKGVTCNWRNIDHSFIVRHMALCLATAFSSGSEFLHVRIWISPEAEDLG